MTKNTNTGLSESGNWHEDNLNPLPSTDWRASLVPAAAVIPAPIAYTKVVAVKKLVVGRVGAGEAAAECCASCAGPICQAGACRADALTRSLSLAVYFEKIRVFKAGARRE